MLSPMTRSLEIGDTKRAVDDRGCQRGESEDEGVKAPLGTTLPREKWTGK